MVIEEIVGLHLILNIRPHVWHISNKIISSITKALTKEEGPNICWDGIKIHISIFELSPLTRCLFISHFVFGRIEGSNF